MRSARKAAYIRIRMPISTSIPTYKDPYGSPLLRMTFDWHENEVKMSAYVTEKLAGVAKAMGGTRIRIVIAQRSLYSCAVPNDA